MGHKTPRHVRRMLKGVSHKRKAVMLAELRRIRDGKYKSTPPGETIIGAGGNLRMHIEYAHG